MHKLHVLSILLFRILQHIPTPCVQNGLKTVMTRSHSIQGKRYHIKTGNYLV